MKRLANPKWALLLENISREECGDIFMAILKYPDVECSSAVWPFIKAELDEDDIKYKAKCERLATNRLARWGEQNSSDTKQILSDIRQTSDAIANSKTNNTNTIEQSKAIQNRTNDILQKLAGSFNVSREPKYHIDNEFSLSKIIQRNPNLFPIFDEFTPEQLGKGQMSLIRKCMGQDKTMAQVIKQALSICKSKRYVFHSPIDHTRPLTDLRKAFWWALDRAELPRMRIHDLRHSFATLATSMGEDIRILKDVLGHTKITTTEIYAHVSSNAARRTANNVASMITG